MVDIFKEKQMASSKKIIEVKIPVVSKVIEALLEKSFIKNMKATGDIGPYKEFVNKLKSMSTGSKNKIADIESTNKKVKISNCAKRRAEQAARTRK